MRPSVSVDEAAVRVDTMWTKRPVLVPRAAVRAVVDLSTTGDPDRSGRFDPHILSLHSGDFRARPELVVVFDQPRLVSGFRFGVESAIAITPTERRRGARRFGVRLEVHDPEAAAGLAAELGVPLLRSVAEAGLPEPSGRRASDVKLAATGLALFLVVLLTSTAVETVLGPEGSLVPRLMVRNILVALAGATGGVGLGLLYRLVTRHPLVLSEPARRALPFSVFLLSVPAAAVVHAVNDAEAWISGGLAGGLAAVGGFYAGGRHWAS